MTLLNTLLHGYDGSSLHSFASSRLRVRLLPSRLPPQAGHQLGLQGCLRRFELVDDLLVLDHQLFRVAVVDLRLVWVFAVQVVVAVGQLLGRDLPGMLGGLAPLALGTTPPTLFEIELGNGQGLGARVGLVG